MTYVTLLVTVMLWLSLRCDSCWSGATAALPTAILSTRESSISTIGNLLEQSFSRHLQDFVANGQIMAGIRSLPDYGQEAVSMIFGSWVLDQEQKVVQEKLSSVMPAHPFDIWDSKAGIQTPNSFAAFLHYAAEASTAVSPGSNLALEEEDASKFIGFWAVAIGEAVLSVAALIFNNQVAQAGNYQN